MALPDRLGSGPQNVVYDRRLAGRRVRHAREDHGWSRAELAYRLNGLTPEDWTDEKVKFVELGRKKIEPPMLRVLMEVLDRPAEYFLYDDHPTRRFPASVKPESRDPRSTLASTSNVVLLDSFRKSRDKSPIPTPAVP